MYFGSRRFESQCGIFLFLSYIWCSDRLFELRLPYMVLRSSIWTVAARWLASQPTIPDLGHFGGYHLLRSLPDLGHLGGYHLLRSIPDLGHLHEVIAIIRITN